MGDDGEIVRDEQIGKVVLALQVDQQIDHLGLDRDVERRDRLVADDQTRVRATARARCRCAGAGRRRTGADSSASGPAASRPDRTVRRPARASRSPVARPWTLSGSPTISPAVMRGLSEANGSWKMICIERRCGRSSALPRWVMSWPLSRMLPPVGSTSRRTLRADRRFAAAGFSPTSPSVSPTPSVKLTPSTACTVPTARRRMPLRTGIMLLQVRYFEQRRRVVGSCGGSRQFRRAPAGRQMAGAPVLQRRIFARGSAPSRARSAARTRSPSAGWSVTAPCREFRPAARPVFAPGDGTVGIEAIRPRV